LVTKSRKRATASDDESTAAIGTADGIEPNGLPTSDPTEAPVPEKPRRKRSTSGSGSRSRAKGGPDPAIEAQIDQFGILYPFAFDEFQREALRIFLGGESVMVAAPTGSGKTIVAEHAVYEAFKRTGRVFYTTPIKALSNQKYRDLRAVYGDQVGLLTGDVSENRDARVVVMTTEVLRNMLLQSPWDLDDVDTVIFDEIHYLADPERGTTWEESIILCPEHVQLVCLSATVSNAPEIAAWIGRTHRPIRLITSDKRPVPLALYYFYDDKLQPVVDHYGAIVKEFKGVGGELRRQGGRNRNGRPGMGQRDALDLDEPQPREIVDALAAQNLLPAIYFLFSRNDCQAFAERLAMMRPHLVKREHLTRINAVIDAQLAGLRPEDRELEQVKLIMALAQAGIGFHHAGLLPILKQLVEVLFARGLMQVVFATDTLALGVNMPARTVVIGRMSKWDGRRRRMLIPNEFSQMSGRAGRRGMDAFGHVVVPYSPWFTFKEVLDVATGTLEPVRSSFAVRYNTVLNLWDPPHGDRVRHMLQQSLAQFQSSQRMRLIEDDVVEIGGDIAAVPKGCLIGYDDGDDLLEEYRALIRSLTAAQHKERRLREELHEAQHELSSGTPWPEPGRQALRRVFRSALPGMVVHSTSWGWGVYLGHGGQGGVGRFLFGDQIRLLTQYKQIDYLPDDKHVGLPQELIEPPDGVTDATDLISPAKLKAIGRKLEKLDLPDLAQVAAEYRQREIERLGETLSGMDREGREAGEQIAALTAARDGHVCHACPVRKDHRDNLTRIDKLEQERNALEELLERETAAEEARIRGVIRGIRDVLHRFGYLHRGYPTAKADMLADVFDNDGLILCEMVERGWLDRLAPEDLAEVFSWFCFDRDYRYTNHFTLPQQLVLFRRRLEDLERDVIGEERDHGLVISEGHNQAFYGAARAWCRGAAMADIGEAIELSEGDLVLTFNKTIDLMRQVREMLLDVAPENPLVVALIQAERLLRRGIVEQSLTIGFAPVPLPEEGTEGRKEGETEGSTTNGAEAAATAGEALVEAPLAAKPKRSTRSRKKPEDASAVLVEAAEIATESIEAASVPPLKMPRSKSSP
jgi:ATP-dependent RNA helicase HelY